MYFEEELEREQRKLLTPFQWMDCGYSTGFLVAAAVFSHRGRSLFPFDQSERKADLRLNLGGTGS